MHVVESEVFEVWGVVCACAIVVHARECEVLEVGPSPLCDCPAAAGRVVDVEHVSMACKQRADGAWALGERPFRVSKYDYTVCNDRFIVRLIFRLSVLRHFMPNQ